MPYAFDPADPDLSASLRRILAEELGAATARLDHIGNAEAVHGIRKNLKKARALLRLVRAGLAEQSAANRDLRDAGLALSARRDAQVRRLTLDRLFPETPEALRPLRAALDAESRSQPEGSPPELLATLSALRARAAAWSLSGKDDRILRQGLAATRRSAGKAAEAARKDPAATEQLHEWRKRAKDLWYQARLFAPVWPELFHTIVADAEHLGEILGDHNDLSVLAAHVADLPDTLLPAAARQLLDAGIREARARIEAEAFPLSARLLAGDPEDVAELWVEWYRVWRGRED